MPTTEIPKHDPALTPTPGGPVGGDLYNVEEWKSAYLDENDVPALLIQLQDDLSRSRQREAFWMSVVVHLTIIILFVNSQRIERLFFRPVIVVQQPTQMMRDKDLTYLQLPPDEQKITKRPETDKLSDKNRIATSKTPQINREELKKILDASRPGRPGQHAPPAQPQQPQQPAAAAGQQAPSQPQAQEAPQQAQQTPPAVNQNQSARLEQPPTARPRPSFSTAPITAGSAIEQAARAALATRGTTYPGDNGDYGLNQGRQPAKSMGPVDILTDTMGVDFGPYLSRILHDIRENWIRAIPPSAEFKKGKVTLQFAIMKDGRVTGIQLFESSGDPPLDRAAWAGVTGSDPLPALPPEFAGSYFGLRLRFCLNMEDCPANK